jgi:hypothetical protein
MLPLIVALALYAPVASPAAPIDSVPADAPAWAPVISYDEVRVDVDTARVTGAGPYTLWLRWSFYDRASSPQSWDAGVRGSLDLVEVDCERGASRTFSSLAYRADGTPVPTASFDEPAATWRVARPESVGGMLTTRVCDLARTRVEP